MSNKQLAISEKKVKVEKIEKTQNSNRKIQIGKWQ